MAEALGVRPRLVRLVSGATSRDKVVEVSDERPSVVTALRELRGDSPA
jgi:uncharacterized protein YggU (UPF0235/DUF167 family)